MKSSSLNVITNVAQVAWTEALSTLPPPHFLQTWEWGALKARYGWRVQRFLYERDGQVVAACTVLTRRLAPLPWTIAYVPKGPLLDYAGTALFETVLEHVAAVAGAARAVYVKVDPDFSAADRQAQRIYRRRGWRASEEQIQFPHTAVLDLSPGPEALLATMKPKTRYNIRLAARRGVEIEQTTDWQTLFTLYAETAARDGFPIREAGYYHALWSAFREAGQGEAFVARVAGEAVAGLYLMHTGDTGWFFTGASSQRQREKMPNYLLQWHAIQWLSARGYRRYDLWGAPDVSDDDDPLWGVYRFKQGFGARYARRLGAYDRVLNRPLYYALTQVMPRYWRLRRRFLR